jgi:hypothetical protein
MSTFALVPRERSDTMFWLVGSRDVFGEAYFVSVNAHGAVELWRNNRPWRANDRIGFVPSTHLTIADVEAALAEENA